MNCKKLFAPRGYKRLAFGGGFGFGFGFGVARYKNANGGAFVRAHAGAIF